MNKIGLNLFDEVSKAYVEGVYADTPANRKFGRVGMTYAAYAEKVKEGGNQDKVTWDKTDDFFKEGSDEKKLWDSWYKYQKSGDPSHISTMRGIFEKKFPGVASWKQTAPNTGKATLTAMDSDGKEIATLDLSGDKIELSTLQTFMDKCHKEGGFNKEGQVDSLSKLPWKGVGRGTGDKSSSNIKQVVKGNIIFTKYHRYNPKNKYDYEYSITVDDKYNWHTNVTEQEMLDLYNGKVTVDEIFAKKEINPEIKRLSIASNALRTVKDEDLNGIIDFAEFDIDKNLDIKEKKEKIIEAYLKAGVLDEFRNDDLKTEVDALDEILEDALNESKFNNAITTDEILAKSEVLGKAEGKRLDAIIKYANEVWGKDTSKLKTDKDKRNFIAMNYIESAELSGSAEEIADSLDEIVEDALADYVPEKKELDLYRASSREIMNALQDSENWTISDVKDKDGKLASEITINGKTWYKVGYTYYRTKEDVKNGKAMVGPEIFEDVDKHLESLIKTTPYGESLRKKVSITKQAFYVKPASQVKNKYVEKVIESGTDYDVLSNSNGELNLIDRTQSDGEEKTYDMGNKTLEEVVYDLNGWNGKETPKENPTKEDIKAEISKKGNGLIPKGNGVWEMNNKYGGAQVLKNDGKIDPSKKGYEVITWDKDYKMDKKKYCKTIKEAHDVIMDSLIKNNVKE